MPDCQFLTTLLRGYASGPPWLPSIVLVLNIGQGVPLGYRQRAEALVKCNLETMIPRLFVLSKIRL